MEIILVYITMFVVALLSTNIILNRTSDTYKRNSLCPQKDTFLKFIESGNHNDKLLRSIKEYSLIKIQNGYYEYGDVLKSLTHKGTKNDETSKGKNKVNA